MRVFVSVCVVMLALASVATAAPRRSAGGCANGSCQVAPAASIQQASSQVVVQPQQQRMAQSACASGSCASGACAGPRQTIRQRLRGGRCR